ncbi:hypothetical protein GF406_05365 [candidate division KSB1 bacterium]|nr:hypothetical protein [candidate division KSB1 bacterium]
MKFVTKPILSALLIISLQSTLIAQLVVKSRDGGTRLMTVTESGRVGIGLGTTDPTATLHTKGTVRMESLPDGSSNTTVLTMNSDGVLGTRPLNNWSPQGLSVNPGSETTSIIDISGSNNDVTLQEGDGISLTESGNTITISRGYSAADFRVMTWNGKVGQQSSNWNKYDGSTWSSAQDWALDFKSHRFLALVTESRVVRGTYRCEYQLQYLDGANNWQNAPNYLHAWQMSTGNGITDVNKVEWDLAPLRLPAGHPIRIQITPTNNADGDDCQCAVLYAVHSNIAGKFFEPWNKYDYYRAH